MPEIIINDALYAHLVECANTTNIEINALAERWIKLGSIADKTFSTKHNQDLIEAVNNNPNTCQNPNQPEGSDVRMKFESTKTPRYSTDASDPLIIIETWPDGTQRKGRWSNRTFSAF